MKVLLIHQYYMPLRGAFSVVFGVETALRGLGHEPIVYASQATGGLTTEYSDFFPKGFTRNEFKVSRFWELPRRAIDGIYSYPARAGLGRLIEATAPDAAIVFRPEYQLSYSVLSELRHRGIPTALWLVDFRYWCSAGFLFNPTLREPCTRCVKGAHWNAIRYRCSEGSMPRSIYDAGVRLVAHTALQLHRLADRYVVPTEATRRIGVSTFSLPADRIDVIPHPFTPIEHEAVPTEAGGHLIFFGRLSPEKGLDVLLRALAIVPGLRLEIYGLDPLGRADAVRAQIQEAGLADRILLSTSLRFGDALVKRLLSAAAVVAPSVWPDTSDYGVLESMALGKAVIVSDGGGNAEIVSAAQAGFVFRTGDAASLASVLATIVHRGADLTEMGRRGRRFIQDRYAPELFSQRLASLLGKMHPTDS